MIFLYHVFLPLFSVSCRTNLPSMSLIGVIRNTEPLDFEKSHNHILSVVAYDCGMKQSVPVMVTIKVNRVCRLGWKGKLKTLLFTIFEDENRSIC